LTRPGADSEYQNGFAVCKAFVLQIYTDFVIFFRLKLFERGSGKLFLEKVFPEDITY
jgi:hypothetical protein